MHQLGPHPKLTQHVSFLLIILHSLHTRDILAIPAVIHIASPYLQAFAHTLSLPFGIWTGNEENRSTNIIFQQCQLDRMILCVLCAVLFRRRKVMASWFGDSESNEGWSSNRFGAPSRPWARLVQGKAKIKNWCKCQKNAGQRVGK